MAVGLVLSIIHIVSPSSPNISPASFASAKIFSIENEKAFRNSIYVSSNEEVVPPKNVFGSIGQCSKTGNAEVEYDCDRIRPGGDW